MSEKLPESSLKLVIKQLWRIWRELCGEPKLRLAYYAIWIILILRQTAHVFYGWCFGYAVEGAQATTFEMRAQLLFVPALLFILIEYVLDWANRLAHDQATTRFTAIAEALVDQRFFEKSIKQHTDGSGQFTQGAMSRGLRELQETNDYLAMGGFESFLGMAVNMSAVWLFSPAHGAFVTFFFLCSYVWARKGNDHVYNDQRRLGEIERALRRRREDLWDAVRRVTHSGRTQEVVTELQNKTVELQEQFRLSWRTYQHRTLVRDLVNWVGFMVVIGWSVHQLVSQAIDLGAFIVLATASNAALLSVRPLARMERVLYKSAPHVERLFELLDLPPDVTDAANPQPLPARPFTVRLEGVGLQRNAQTVLNNITFSVGPGERVALIGASGAGKSTIADLLKRDMDPTMGRILIDDTDLRNIRRADWLTRVSSVNQNREIIDGTLRDNILFGLPPEERRYWTDERLWPLVQQFRVDFGKDRLPSGLDTSVGRHGIQLSGGEAQRVLILAAAIKAPQFMVIDEATSALDAENQVVVQAALDELLKRSGASALIIAHRLSTIRQCTKFIVLSSAATEGPQIEAVASSLAELYNTSPTYRKLHDLEHDEPVHAPVIPEA